MRVSSYISGCLSLGRSESASPESPARRGAARRGYRPRPRRKTKSERHTEREGGGGYLDRIGVPVCVVAAIGGGCTGSMFGLKL